MAASSRAVEAFMSCALTIQCLLRVSVWLTGFFLPQKAQPQHEKVNGDRGGLRLWLFRHRQAVKHRRSYMMMFHLLSLRASSSASSSLSLFISIYMASYFYWFLFKTASFKSHWLSWRVCRSERPRNKSHLVKPRNLQHETRLFGFRAVVGCPSKKKSEENVTVQDRRSKDDERKIYRWYLGRRELSSVRAVA